MHETGDQLSGKPGTIRDFDSCQMSGILVKVGEVSGKNLAINCLLLVAYLHPYQYLVAFMI